MRRVIELCCLVFAVCFLSSCKPGAESPAGYIRALKENEMLNKALTIGEVDYTFRIQTPELMALKMATTDGHGTDPEKYKKRLAELEGYLYVNIEMQLHNRNGSILKYNLKDQSEYDQRIMYYEFYAKDDVRLVCNGAEVVPGSYQYENHLDLMPYNTIVAAFPVCRDGKEFQVAFNDRALHNLFLKVNFKQEDINSLPKLKLN